MIRAIFVYRFETYCCKVRISFLIVDMIEYASPPHLIAIAPPQAKVLVRSIRPRDGAVHCCDTTGAEVAGPGTLLGDLSRPLPGHQPHDTPQLPAQRDTRLPLPGVLPGRQPVSAGHRSGKRVSSAVKYNNLCQKLL